MVIWDFTGIGILLGFLFTAVVFFFIALVALIVYAAQRRHQGARAIMMPAIFFFLFNLFLSALYYNQARGIALETKRFYEPLVFCGWLPVNLIVYLCVAAILRKMKSKEI